MTNIRYLLLLLVAHIAWAGPSSRLPANDPDYIAPLARHLPVTEGSRELSVVSWNVKHLGRPGFNAADAAPLLSDSDIVTLQEVNTKESGLKALNQLAAELESRTKQKICKGLSEKPTDGTERYAYLWKDTRVAYVKTDGNIMETCPSSAITIRLGVRHAKSIMREPAVGVFYFRPEARAFVLASIHLRPSGKKPQEEVRPLFETLHGVLLPVIVAGDYNLDSAHPAFNTAREMGFTAVLRGVKTSLKMKKRELSKPYDNFWTRGVQLRAVRVVNLHEAFPALDPKMIYKSLSDHCPVVASFSLPPQTAPAAAEL